ncbi:hypothetical protein N9W43_06985 [Litoricolaceae bacterium]|nr:hypothetical protein [Litorivicinaceae bacterium]
MIKLIIAFFTMFSVMTTTMMQGYVDRANAIYGQIDPKYANTLSVETRPSVYLQVSREVVESARGLAPGLAEDVDNLLGEYEGKVSIDQLKERLEAFEQQARQNPALLETKKYIEGASVYVNETVMTLALDLALDDLSSLIDESWYSAETLWDELLADDPSG